MRVGTLCYATDSGLGILAKSFYDHGVITDPIVIRHGTHPTHEDWYPCAYHVGSLRSKHDQQVIEDSCKSVDAMLFFETPFIWELIPFCRARGVKTVLMPMHECMPSQIPHQPDAYICPSDLDMDWAVPQGPDCYRVNVPVDSRRTPWRLRERAEVFVHNAGHGGLKGRNGTRELLDAIPLLKSNARLIIRSQKPIEAKLRDSMQDVDLIHGTVPDSELYAQGDVFVFPEQFNGLSLPLQEAYASGMAVMATNRYPVNTWLPIPMLMPPDRTAKDRIGPPYTMFDRSFVSPEVIAATIDRWYGQPIAYLSEKGREWAMKNSWEALRTEYNTILVNVLRG